MERCDCLERECVFREEERSDRQRAGVYLSLFSQQLCVHLQRQWVCWHLLFVYIIHRQASLRMFSDE